MRLKLRFTIKKLKNIVIAATRSDSKQEPKQLQARKPYNQYEMLSIMTLMKKMIETQAVTMLITATQTLDGLNASVFYC